MCWAIIFHLQILWTNHFEHLVPSDMAKSGHKTIDVYLGNDLLFIWIFFVLESLRASLRCSKRRTWSWIILSKWREAWIVSGSCIRKTSQPWKNFRVLITKTTKITQTKTRSLGLVCMHVVSTKHANVVKLPLFKKDYAWHVSELRTSKFNLTNSFERDRKTICSPSSGIIFYMKVKWWYLAFCSNGSWHCSRQTSHSCLCEAFTSTLLN